MAPLRPIILLAGFLVLLIASQVGYAFQSPPPGRLPASVFETPEPPLADDTAEQNVVQPAGMQVPGTRTVLQPGSVPVVSPANIIPIGETLPTPAISLSLRGPDHADKNREIYYVLTVSNNSAADAYDVVVTAKAPAGIIGGTHRLLYKEDAKAEPVPIDGKIRIGTMKIGTRKQIEYVFKPDQSIDKLKFLAMVSFEHGVVVQTQLSNPGLGVAHKIMTPKVIRNVPFACRIELKNSGKVPITELLVTETLGSGLELDPAKSPSPKPLDARENPISWKIDVLQPGQTRVIDYRLIARTGDNAEGEYKVACHGVDKSEKWKANVADANISLEVTAPKQALIQTPTWYDISVKNSGTAELSNVLVNCNLPRDVKATGGSNNAQYFGDSVQWVLPKMKPNEEKRVRVKLESSKEGSRVMTFAVRANPGVDRQKQYDTDFYGSPTLDWKTEALRINDLSGVGSVGDVIGYTITINNRGNGPAKKVNIRVDLPPEVEFQEQATPATFRTTQSGLIFDPFDIPAGEKREFTVKAKAKASGEAVFKFYLSANHFGEQEPLRQEKVTNISGK